jgi:hypothetical protein
MYGKIFANIILIIGLAAIQLSFISGLPPVLSSLNIIIVSAVWWLNLSGLKTAMWRLAGIGYILDLYSFAPAGVYLISLLAVALLTHWLLNNFFTDRSLYAFVALTFFATVAYEATWRLFGALAFFIARHPQIWEFGRDFWLDKAYLAGLNLAAVIAAFYFYGFISKRLKPVFLSKSKF